jgi:GH35 family endo-1,4-beta-xylanase
MPVLFDSCFDPQEVNVDDYRGKTWIPSPGFPRLGEKDRPAMRVYIRDIVGKYRNDPRIVMWDVVNEPESTA